MTIASPAIIWTRALSDWHDDALLLVQAGIDLADVVQLPAIRVTDVASVAPLLYQPHLLVMTSANAVPFALSTPTFKALWHGDLPVYTQSPKAAAALHQQISSQGLRLHVRLRDFRDGCRTAQDLAMRMIEELQAELNGRKPEFLKILSLGAATPAYDLAGALQAAGFTAQHLACYQTEHRLTDAQGGNLTAAAWQKLTKASMIVFASPSAVQSFMTAIADIPERQQILNKLTAVVLGPTTAAAAAPYFKQVKVSAQNQLSELIVLLKTRPMDTER